MSAAWQARPSSRTQRPSFFGCSCCSAVLRCATMSCVSSHPNPRRALHDFAVADCLRMLGRRLVVFMALFLNHAAAAIMPVRCVCRAGCFAAFRARSRRGLALPTSSGLTQRAVQRRGEKQHAAIASCRHSARARVRRCIDPSAGPARRGSRCSQTSSERPFLSLFCLVPPARLLAACRLRCCDKQKPGSAATLAAQRCTNCPPQQQAPTPSKERLSESSGSAPATAWRQVGGGAKRDSTNWRPPPPLAANTKQPG